MDFKEQINLKAEIQHIFDTGANEDRIFEMVKAFIDNGNLFSERQMDNAYDKGFRDGVSNVKLTQ